MIKSVKAIQHAIKYLYKHRTILKKRNKRTAFELFVMRFVFRRLISFWRNFILQKKGVS